LAGTQLRRQQKHRPKVQGWIYILMTEIREYRERKSAALLLLRSSKEKIRLQIMLAAFYLLFRAFFIWLLFFQGPPRQQQFQIFTTKKT
jgi:hypothetical protein